MNEASPLDGASCGAKCGKHDKATDSVQAQQIWGQEIMQPLLGCNDDKVSPTTSSSLPLDCLSITYHHPVSMAMPVMITTMLKNTHFYHRSSRWTDPPSVLLWCCPVVAVLLDPSYRADTERKRNRRAYESAKQQELPSLRHIMGATQLHPPEASALPAQC